MSIALIVQPLGQYLHCVPEGNKRLNWDHGLGHVFTFEHDTIAIWEVETGHLCEWAYCN